MTLRADIFWWECPICNKEWPALAEWSVLSHNVCPVCTYAAAAEVARRLGVRLDWVFHRMQTGREITLAELDGRA